MVDPGIPESEVTESATGSESATASEATTGALIIDEALGAVTEDTAAKQQATVVHKSRESQSPLLAVGGASLLAYSSYSIIFLIASNPSPAPIAVLDRITGFISLLPQFILGFVLLFQSFSPQAIQSESIWKKLLRQLVALLAIAYLVCAPISTIQAISQRRVEISNFTRANQQLQERKQQIMGAIANLTSKEQFETALQQFTEIRAIRIDPTAPPAETIAGVETAIDNALDLQIQNLRVQVEQRLSGLQSRAELATAGSLVSGIAFVALGVQVVPWMAGLARFISQLQKQAMLLFRPLLQRLPGTGKSKASPEAAAKAAKARAESARRIHAKRAAAASNQRRWQKAWAQLQSNLAKLRPGGGTKRSPKSSRRRRS